MNRPGKKNSDIAELSSQQSGIIPSSSRIFGNTGDLWITG
jgi:hypothetical protein